MAQASAQGGMEIKEQRETFHSFLSASLWVGVHVAQLVALLTFAFAIGAGWWMGWLVFVLIGVGVGLGFKMSGAYWALQVAEWVLLGVGGLVVPAIAGLMG